MNGLDLRPVLMMEDDLCFCLVQYFWNALRLVLRMPVSIYEAPRAEECTDPFDAAYLMGEQDNLNGRSTKRWQLDTMEMLFHWL